LGFKPGEPRITAGRRVAEEVAGRLRVEGARAVILVGSFVAGGLHPHSDVGLVAFGKVIPGWRTARILRDPHSIARRLQQAARRRRWSSISRQADRRVADDLTLRAESVRKMLGCLAAGDRTTAAVKQAVLAIVLPPVDGGPPPPPLPQREPVVGSDRPADG
jgi:hypothetical protein